jgi:hypothetical protein
MINRNLIHKLSPIFAVTCLFLLCNPMTAALPSGESLCIQPKVIYGVDNRQEYYEINDPFVKELADSTLALVDRRQLQNLPGAPIQIGRKAIWICLWTLHDGTLLQSTDLGVLHGVSCCT